MVYCDNTGKSGERVLDKILDGRKTMLVRGAAGRKFRIAPYLKTRFCISWKKAVQNFVKLSEENSDCVIMDLYIPIK